jgi:hypothetical protein
MTIKAMYAPSTQANRSNVRPAGYGRVALMRSLKGEHYD